MNIEKMTIKGFGKIANRTFDLKEGLNVFYGGNESGKTTIQWIIKGLLFGLKGGRSSKEGVLPPAKRFKPWRGGHFGGIMEYRLDNGCVFRIERDFEKNHARVYDSNFNDVTDIFTTGKARNIQIGESHLGLNEACFDKTVLIGQMDTAIDSSGSMELMNRLVNVSETGFEDVSYRKAEKALKNALKMHVGTGKTSTRPLDRVEEKLTLLEEKKKNLLERRQTMFAEEQELMEAELEIRELELKTELLDEAGAMVEEKKNIIRNRTILDKLNSYMNQLGNSQKSEQSNVSNYFLLAAGLCAVMFVLLGYYSSRFFYAGAAAALLGVVIIALRKAAALNAHVRSGDINDIFNRASAACGVYISSSDQLEAVINGIQQETRSAEQKLDSFVNKYRGRLQQSKKGEYNEDEILNLVLNLGESLTEEDLQEIAAHREYDFKKQLQNQDTLRVRVTELKTLLRNFPDNSDIQQLEEEIQELKEKKCGLDDLNNALEVSAKVLSEAAEEIQRDFTPQLNSRMSKIISSVSGGKYTELRTDNDLRLKTVIPETGNIGEAQDLSGGTIDQMYFALRVAAAELIEASGETLPLIMDEPFAQYDDLRLDRVFEYLGKLCLNRQVILFTCRERELEAAELSGSLVNIIRI